IGVVQTASQSSARFGLEPTREFVVKLYNGSLESRTEAEVRGERVNLALYGKGSRWEVIQFLTVEAQTPSDPFVAQYRVVGVVSGQYGTEVNSYTHQADDYFVLVDGAVQSFPMRPADVTLSFDFIGQTAGQALADAESAGVSTFTFQGTSAKPLAIARVETDEATGLAPRDSAGTALVQVWPRTNVEDIGDEYLIEYLTDDRTAIVHSATFREGGVQPALLVSRDVNSPSSPYSNVTKNTLAVATSVGLTSTRAASLQVIRRTENFVEATLKATGDGAATLGLIRAAAVWRGSFPPADGFFVSAVNGVAPGIYVSVNGGSNVFVADYFSGDEVRVRVRVTGGRVLFYVNAVTDSDPPVYETAEPPEFPLRLYLSAGSVAGTGTARVADAFLTIDPFAATVFTDAQQQRYYGALKSPIQVRIRQHSGVRDIGWGLAWEGAI
ncbi:MAG TPA: hypothetical protein VF521_08625, partial [Pyrinomonadaceae bacterium]